MTIEEIRILKAELGYSNARLSNESGVPLGTVNKALSGASAHPRYDTLLAMWKILKKKKEELTPVSQNVDNKYAHAPAEALLREEAALYGISQEKGPGDFTIADYLQVSEEYRLELIDGVFYDMAAPSVKHQRTVGAVYFQLKDYIRNNGELCEVFTAPVDVQLNEQDNRTILQPDVFVVCNQEYIREERILGAPDFIVEVTSPSTRKKDLFIKLTKYALTGVREYWVVDLQNETVTVHLLENAVGSKIYPLDAKIPVGIYQGRLEIDFSEN
ncbi:MAG: Uma2 family endonuclease [Lachnospiraceae bacterium]|nr:Uma2 family endonuclease [Lachnospiraceae bacterium]